MKTNDKIVSEYFSTIKRGRLSKEDLVLLKKLQSIVKEKITEKGYSLNGIGDNRIGIFFSELIRERDKKLPKQYQRPQTFFDGNIRGVVHSYKVNLPSD